MSDNFIILLIIAAAAMVGILFATNRKRAAAGLAAKGVLGGAAIWGINYAVAFLGFAIVLPGLNLLTIALVAFLGLPGLVMIYGVGFFA